MKSGMSSLIILRKNKFIESNLNIDFARFVCLLKVCVYAWWTFDSSTWRRSIVYVLFGFSNFNFLIFKKAMSKIITSVFRAVSCLIEFEFFLKHSHLFSIKKSLLVRHHHNNKTVKQQEKQNFTHNWYISLKSKTSMTKR